MVKQAVAADFGLQERQALRFNHRTMTICGCRCVSCRNWKTLPENRRFWIDKDPTQ